MQQSLYEFILLFTLFSVMGWVCESIWCSVGQRKLVNRGFLNGPYCPIYGFGGLFILAVCLPVRQYPVLVFVLALLAASILEYFTGWLLETLFHTRWWDYSKRFLNIKGRVCLRNAVLFGLMGLAVTYFVYPPLGRALASISVATQRILCIGILALLAVDLTQTLITLSGMQKRLHMLRETLHELEQMNTAHEWYDPRDLHASVERLRVLCQQNPKNDASAAILARLDAITARRASAARLLGAFPTLTHKDLPAELNALRETWRERIAERKRNRKK